MEPSQPYSPEINVAECLVLEHWTRSHVLIFGNNLRNTVCGEALTFTNWLSNRLLSSIISIAISITRCNPNVETDFSNIPRFGQSRFAFIHRSKTVMSK